MSTSPFSAGAAAIGYLYQARYALYSLLQRRDDCIVFLERFDDLEFEGSGTPTEQLQLKHHSSPGSLTDASLDLWKTMRVWAESIRTGVLDPKTALCTIVTTSSAQPGSIASKLRPGIARNVDEITIQLDQVASHSENVALRPAFDAYGGLTSEAKRDLVSAIQIYDNSPMIGDTAEKTRSLLMNGVDRKHRSAVYERLEGWWFERVISELASPHRRGISAFETRDRLTEINVQFAPEALPIDYLNAMPADDTFPDQETRRFVLQLLMITLKSSYITKAIVDYYRAFEQRSRWVRDELLFVDELEQYETRLVDEWERFYEYQRTSTTHGSAAKDMIVLGQSVFLGLEQKQFPIRPRVSEPYVSRGSFHILADQDPPRVYWHPQFLERLQKLVTTAELSHQ